MDLVWEYKHTPALFTAYAGSAQRLRDGNTLIAFSTAGVMTEVDPAGRIAWEGVLRNGSAPTYLYRGVKIVSLYRYERP